MTKITKIRAGLYVTNGVAHDGRPYGVSITRNLDVNGRPDGWTVTAEIADADPFEERRFVFEDVTRYLADAKRIAETLNVWPTETGRAWTHVPFGGRPDWVVPGRNPATPWDETSTL